MTVEMWVTTMILIGMFGLLIKTKIPPVVIFVGALTLTITFRLAPLGESLKGFSNQGMLTVGALLMVATGMYSTGAITLITEKFIGRPKNLTTAQMKILPPVALGSAFLNNTPIVAMFMPVIRDLSRTARLPATRLYIPLSYASILGMCLFFQRKITGRFSPAYKKKQ
jgi:Na+/H+ antiporter NhaD/arsenite permease-like protein